MSTSTLCVRGGGSNKDATRERGGPCTLVRLPFCALIRSSGPCQSEGQAVYLQHLVAVVIVNRQGSDAEEHSTPQGKNASLCLRGCLPGAGVCVCARVCCVALCCAVLCCLLESGLNTFYSQHVLWPPFRQLSCLSCLSIRACRSRIGVACIGAACRHRRCHFQWFGLVLGRKLLCPLLIGFSSDQPRVFCCAPSARLMHGCLNKFSRSDGLRPKTILRHRVLCSFCLLFRRNPTTCKGPSCEGMIMQGK